TFANEPGRFAVSGLLVAHYASDAMTLSWRRLSANAIIEAESAAHAISVGQQLVLSAAGIINSAEIWWDMLEVQPL
ncbi:MAG: hypothetical protein HC876_22820, partial [Chloroflexaceae bacterium]|nr:hypothetical protein [Chloroflexaceae bacterium]